MFQEKRVTAWIGGSLVVEGSLTSSEDITIAGEIRGDVAVREHKLLVAPKGTIRGDIVARTVEVFGVVEGSITSDGKVTVAESGSVDGNITAPRLELAEGATMRGTVSVGGSA